MNAMETRKLAQSLGIKNAAKFSKVELEAMIGRIQKDIELAKRLEASTKPVRKQSKRCEMGCGRPASSTSPEGRECVECITEAEWMNTHSDFDHADGADEATMVGCWICHPELNKASKTYVAPKGSSRLGMTLTVPSKASGQEKAEVVASKIGYEFGTAKITASKGITTLTAGDLKLVWDINGRFVAAGSSLDGKKVRNVSEAFRLMNK